MPPSIHHRQLFDPRSLRDALSMLRDEGPLMPIAGCTDVYVAMNFGTLKQTRFMNLWRLNELRGIDRRAGRLRIGALTTYTELMASPAVNRAMHQSPEQFSRLFVIRGERNPGGVKLQHAGQLLLPHRLADNLVELLVRFFGVLLPTRLGRLPCGSGDFVG